MKYRWKSCKICSSNSKLRDFFKFNKMLTVLFDHKQNTKLFRNNFIQGETTWSPFRVGPKRFELHSNIATTSTSQSESMSRAYRRVSRIILFTSSISVCQPRGNRCIFKKSSTPCFLNASTDKVSSCSFGICRRKMSTLKLV